MKAVYPSRLYSPPSPMVRPDDQERRIAELQKRYAGVDFDELARIEHRRRGAGKHTPVVAVIGKLRLLFVSCEAAAEHFKVGVKTVWSCVDRGTPNRDGWKFERVKVGNGGEPNGCKSFQS